VDIFKSFKFGEGESKDVYKDVLGKLDNFCKKTSNKIIKRHQLLSKNQECLSIDEYVTNLHCLYVMSVARLSSEDTILQSTGDYTPERNPFSARGVVRSFVTRVSHLKHYK